MSVRAARDLAYEEIRSRILKYDLLPGQRLDENGLAGEIGVSRTPVREALHRLISDELVGEAPRGGYAVSSITVEKLRALMEAHDIVAQSVSQLLVGRATAEDFVRLEAANHAFDSAATSQDPAAIAEANARLHILEAALTRNPYLEGLATKVHLNLQRLAFVSFGGGNALGHVDDLSSHFARVCNEHREYLNALRARDSEAAVSIAIQHAVLLEERILHYLTAVGELSIQIRPHDEG